MIAGSTAAFLQLCDELHITHTHTHTHTKKGESGFLVGCGHLTNTTPKGLSTRLLVMSLNHQPLHREEQYFEISRH